MPRRGFTLLELLIVVLIVVVLALLLGAVGTDARRAANRTLCISHLHQIGQAWGLRAANERIGRAGPFNVRAWTGLLAPYLEGREDVFTCPEGGSSEGGFLTDITELVEFRVVSGGGTWYTQLEPGPFMLKLSVTQYDKARGMGLLGNDNSANNIDTLHPEFRTYTPDSTPQVYWLCMEDHGGDQDFKDAMTRVTENNDGTVTLECISGATGHTNALMDKTTGQELFRTGSNQWDFSPDRTVTLVVGGSASSSYGMNSSATDLRAPDKVLVLDYAWFLARTTDIWADPEVDADENGVPDFARHGGRINVLYLDGSVRGVAPETIDPVRPSVARTEWLP